MPATTSLTCERAAPGLESPEDLVRLDLGPLVASHAGAHAASRILTSAQLDAIGTSDGLVGIV
jgi:hypothetical protein